MHGEGRYRSATGRHEYTMRDHLGITRLVYADADNNGVINVATEILQETHFYPFGMEMNGSYFQQGGYDYRYKFNGIERINDLSLGIDMAFYRGLDPTTGRWLQVDPKAEHDISTSPYVSHYNSPVNVTDPLGDCPFCFAFNWLATRLATLKLASILPTVTITASKVLSISSIAARATVTIAALPTLTQNFVLPLYDKIIESGYTAHPFERTTFFESDPGTSGRTLHIEHTLRAEGEVGRYIANTYYRWYDSSALLEKLGGPNGVVEMMSNLAPPKAAGSSISKSLIVLAAKRGTQVNSKTLWKGKGKERIDVENPNPAQRPSQVHYQDNKGGKYIYDHTTGQFKNASDKVNDLLKNPDFKRGIEKGLKYLGL